MNADVLPAEPPPLAGGDSVSAVLGRLAWMRSEGIWPWGMRYLWTDGFGVVLLVSLAEITGEDAYLDLAEEVVTEVDLVLGRRPGYRIGEAPDRDGQYFHYLSVWEYALGVLGSHRPGYTEKALRLVTEVHPHFVVPGVGVYWKMLEDLSGPYPGFGLGGLDPYQGLAVYRYLDAGTGVLSREIGEMADLVERSWREMIVTQDLGLGMMLWSAALSDALVPGEEWTGAHIRRGLTVLDRMWIDPPGYFCRQPELPRTRFAFTNYGVALGLESVHAHPERVAALIAYFDTYRSGDHYDREAITHVMGCVARLPGSFLPPTGG